MALTLIQPGYYVDSYDQRLVAADMSEFPDFFSVTKFFPLKSDNSRPDVYWHVDLPLDGYVIALSGAQGTDCLVIEGKVEDVEMVDRIIRLSKGTPPEIMQPSGYVHSNDYYLMGNEYVRQQIEQKRADLRRLYPDLLALDLIDIQSHTQVSHQFLEDVLAQYIRSLQSRDN